MRASAIPNTVPATNALHMGDVLPLRTLSRIDALTCVRSHLRHVATQLGLARGLLCGGIILCFLAAFLQPLGLIAADTKLDLVINPGQFLSSAWSIYNDRFTFGQLQNQAYGYLFPQGLFFLLFHWIGVPAWIIQRLWWGLVLSVGFSGFFLLATSLGLHLSPATDRSSSSGDRVQRAHQGGQILPIVLCFLAALAYTFAPRTIATIGAISSETWPVMLTPWILLPFVRMRHGAAPRWPVVLPVAGSVLAVGCLGAINATASAAACVPTGLYLVVHIIQRHRHALSHFLLWILGCILVCAWWLWPLILLGRFSPPFTDFIENAHVTTRWLNLAEILRGTTSWTPFISTERVAGHAQATEEVFIIAGLIVAGLGLWGLSALHRRDQNTVESHYWILLIGLGLTILAGAHLVTAFLDSPLGSALRNVHKFDPLIRLPLSVGIAALGCVLSRISWLNITQKAAATSLIALSVLTSSAPVWSGQLLPAGSFSHIPSYWYEATHFLNTHAANTRTLILPASSFARHSWGWTRDEPAQPLLQVPWAVRDSIPLVSPETIRGLDGLSDELSAANLQRHGIGAVLVRTDLSTPSPSPTIDLAATFPKADIHHFGPVSIALINPTRSLMLSNTHVPRVAGGGEVLNLLPEGSYQLVDSDADIVTDTPMAIARNYGNLHATSGPVTNPDAETDVLNPVKDYPSAGPLTRLKEEGGQIKVSSCACDATNFPRPNLNAIASAALDGRDSTAWYPRLGATGTPWIELIPNHPVAEPTATVLLAARGVDTPVAVEVTLDTGQGTVTQVLTTGKRTQLQLPGKNITHLRLSIGHAATPIGVADISLARHPISHHIEVPATSPNATSYLFQRIFTPTEQISRRFHVAVAREFTVHTTPCTTSVLIDTQRYRCGARIHLGPGWHDLDSYARIVTLTAADAPTPPALIDVATLPTPDQRGLLHPNTGVITQAHISPSDHDRYLLTSRSHNPGLEGTLNGHALDATTLNAGMQAYLIPAGASGEFHLRFSHARSYQYGLLFGSLSAGIVMLLSIICISSHRRRPQTTASTSQSHSEPTSSTCLRWISFLAISLGLSCAVGWWIVPIIATVWAILRYTLIPAPALIAAFTITAAMWLARAPWPQPSYGGDYLILELVSAAAILAACLPQPRRSS
ncbi:MAG: alpha-(1-_3)-arabinofuranosyltransferase family protein [Corynebacterium sp.]|uniref:alpha-(1->3)-arabinofuranosyltransferase domain-containing protein n=1 Tax=Corynebacterium sp. TaxID=1720 RepID=UPI0026DBD6AC|nr:alpha-(1->3)-arabinofuranosyltransferase family protein [Corynebacterium sp.]MDO4762556.1 alpha-(1->3)-arabinofuranosyltransferase family protein [Corynebacterium sp.]